jgi:hypothetical protein
MNRVLLKLEDRIKPDRDDKENSLNISDFEIFRNNILHQWLRTLTMLGYTLVPLFFILDYLSAPIELLHDFALLRLFSVVIIVIQNLIIRNTNPGRFSFIHGYIVSINVGGSICVMTLLLWGEMELAKRIQTALLPSDEEIYSIGSREMGRYYVAAKMLPAEEVGGDYYDVIENQAGEGWIAIGDVTGHGVESGLIMMMTQTSIYSLVNNTSGNNPSTILSAVNGIIKKNITLFRRYSTT